MKKVLLNLFNSQYECFIKLGKTNDYIFKKLFVNYNFKNFEYKCAGHINFLKKIFLNILKIIMIEL